MSTPAPSLPPPEPRGPVVATVKVAVPAGHEGRLICAGLKQDGLVLARGQAPAPAGGEVLITLRALTATTVLSDGGYDLWLTLDTDGWLSCYPGFGDWSIHQAWSLTAPAPQLIIDDPSLWQQRTLSRPENLITFHYHRYDEDYDHVGLWSWDALHRRSPAQNELFEIGRDEFGLVYQMDRADYGPVEAPATRIGLVPRQHGDWDRKDGEDKFWTPKLGQELWLIGTRAAIWTERPETRPHVADAFIDGPNRLVIQLSHLVTPGSVAPAAVHVTDETGHTHTPVNTQLAEPRRDGQSTYIEVTLFEPLAAAQRVYTVRVSEYAGQVRAVPRGVLEEESLFGDRQTPLGAQITTTGTTFRVFAPTATAVDVVLYDAATGDAGRTTQPLRPAGGGIWETTVAGDLVGRYYVYQLAGPDLSTDHEALDIYAVNAVHNSTRARLTDLDRTDPPGWDRDRHGPLLAAPVDLVVYEMHVRDFTIAPSAGARQPGTYLGFTEAETHLPDEPALKTGLDHLTELGITHVQLLPIQDFANDETDNAYNWGYVTTAFNTPEAWYASGIDDDSRIREFKQLVAALHQQGIGVILDVVYNHTGAGASFNRLVPRYYYRFLPDGSPANGSGCGNDFRSESPMGRRFIIDSLRYWVEEYGIDGFRFDLMALIDLETMREAERVLRAIKPDIVLYGEPWTAGPSALRGAPTDKAHLRGTGIGAFNDHFRNAVKGGPDGATTGFIQDGTRREAVLKGVAGSVHDWADQPGQSINYLTCHDNLVLIDKLQLSKPGATEPELIAAMKLGYLLLFTAQGVPFLHGGEEFARTKGGNHNSYNAGDEVNQIDWSRKRTHQDLFRYTRDLIRLRRDHPVFRLRTKEQIEARLKFPTTTDARVIAWTLEGRGLPGESWAAICVLANSADKEPIDVALPEGRWQVACDAQGAVAAERTMEKTVSLPPKSGLILYQP
ncbi:type I pullulanase [bacterium]|nr:type I pullulanase [bacterium]